MGKAILPSGPAVLKLGNVNDAKEDTFPEIYYEVTIFQKANDSDLNLVKSMTEKIDKSL